ncbi:TIR domain-containing protein [Sphingomonas ginsengisoli (ex An et al. 2013)]|uniref:TIR domain-containing protein n=1 Tax=Sphingomonas ginsengisoli (ex An et al. 2013) TaxID=363835 RepID=UPI0023DD1E13|nr:MULTISPECIES: TIR domain-containing protein [Sphingomonas]
MPAGAAWEATIERELTAADAVIVCWSAASTQSENVRSEARLARERGRLVQVYLDDSAAPLFFGERQGIDLRGWSGGANDPTSRRLSEALREVLGGERIAAPPAGTAKVERRWSWRMLAAVGLPVLLLAAVGAWWWSRPAAAPTPARVAVTGVTSLDRAPTTAALATGLADEISSGLTSAHIPTVSQDQPAGPSAGAGADYTIGGTVAQQGGQLHARIHLDDSRQRLSLWTYELAVPASDSVRLNDQVAEAIAGVVSCAYRGLGPSGLTDSNLLSRYLRVCDLFVNHNDAGDTRSTFELLGDLRRITQAAPDFVPARTDFAKFGAYLAPLLAPEQAAAVRAEAAAQATRALELDPKAADAWLAREMLLKPTQWAERERLLRRAVAVNPDWPHSNGFLAQLLTETGRMSEAAVYAQRASAADLQIDWRPYASMVACEAGQADSTIADLREQMASASGGGRFRFALIQCLIDAGRYAEAMQVQASIGARSSDLRLALIKAAATKAPADLAAAKRLTDAMRPNKAALPLVIQAYAQLGDLDAAFAAAQDYSPGYPMTGIVAFLFYQATAPMRADPRFKPLMERYGLWQFWQSTGRWPDYLRDRKGGPA